jgi:hypothetical protein
VSETAPIEKWDDTGWSEGGDNSWTAGCRWLQSWWREQQGHLPGPRSNTDGRLVGSMLRFDAPEDANFLDREIVAAVKARLAEGDHSGIIEKDRLRRNLLSSQPTCFNLFGPFVSQPNGLKPWVETLDGEVTTVDVVRFEWAPERAAHFDGGSAFDAFIEYTAGDARRFIGVECKYAENLAATSIKVRDVYIDFTEASGYWIRGAATRLDQKKLRQFWLNTLLAQSLASRPARTYERGMAVVVACAADVSAHSASEAVRAELQEPDRWLRWSPYEEVLATVDGRTEWKRAFRERYLDFGPVQHRLGKQDRRRGSHL